jgi:hypothetical protein
MDVEKRFLCLSELSKIILVPKRIINQHHKVENYVTINYF